MRIRTTHEADDDISRLYAYGFRQYGEAQANAYLQGLRKLFELLAASPLIARERAEFDPPVRVHRYGSHMVIYRIAGNDILIVRVMSGRQDWQSELGASA